MQSRPRRRTLTPRAIRDGVIPALKAARTAFNLPLVNKSGTSSTRRLRGLSSNAGGFLPRRRCSAVAAVINWSSSASVSLLIAFGRSLGRTRRTAALGGKGGGGFIGGEERSPIVENRSGVVEPVRSLPIVLSCCVLQHGKRGTGCLNLRLASHRRRAPQFLTNNHAGTDCCPTHAARSSDVIRLTQPSPSPPKRQPASLPASIPRHASSTT